MHPVSEPGREPARQVQDLLADAEQAFERGDHVACSRLVNTLMARGVNQQQEAGDVLDRARELEARLRPGRAFAVIGTICAALLAGVFAYYVIPW